MSQIWDTLGRRYTSIFFAVQGGRIIYTDVQFNVCGVLASEPRINHLIKNSGWRPTNGIAQDLGRGYGRVY